MLPSFEVLLQPLGNIFEWVLQQGQALAYAFGLLTVGCLALRRNSRGIAISGLLSLLWVWMGIGFLREDPAWGNPATWLGLAILVQSGLFLWFGAIRSRLWVEPRASIRPVAGAALLVLALAVFPLLRQVLQLSWSSSTALPFPGLLLTFGLLLFLKRPVPLGILAIPLAWVALGGDRIFEAMSWVDGVQLAAFVAGLSLLIAPRAELRDGDGNYRSEDTYEMAYRCHQRWGRLLWGLLFAACFFVSLSSLLHFPRLNTLLDHLAASSCAALAFGLVLWLSLPAWHSVSFRYLAWWAVRIVRGSAMTGRWLVAKWWRVLAVLSASVLTGWWLGLREVNFQAKWDDGTIQSLLVAIVAVVFLRAVYVARRRIVISPFVDCRTKKEKGEEEAEGFGKALANRLRNELVNISELYRTIDDALPAQKNQTVLSAVAVEDIVESVLDAVGPETMKIRTMEIPIGLLIRAIGRVVHGPRLTGSFQQIGDKRYLLLAELSGGRWRTHSWKISSEDLGEDEKSGNEMQLSQRMIEHLACRIIARIGNVGSPRWEAVYHFTKALRAYRGTQLAARDAGPDLRSAEREFIKALQEDQSFTQCHYDLGVVYKELKESSSAEASFRRCLADDPGRAEAYYSLADVYFDDGDSPRASIYAGKALETRPAEARAWNLRGVAQETSYRESESSDEPKEHRRRSRMPEEVLTDIEIAVAVSWRALCRAALAKPAELPRKEMQVAGLTLANLAIIRMDSREPESLEASARNIRQALQLYPQDPWYHLILGEALAQMGRWEEAKTELYRAFGDSLEPEENADRWAYLLAVASRLLSKSENLKHREQMEKEVRRAFRNFLDAAVPPEELILAGGQQRSDLQQRYGKILEQCHKNLSAVEDLVTKEGAKRVAALKNCLLLLRRLYVEPQKKVPIPRPVFKEEREWRQVQIEIHRAWEFLQVKASSAILRLGSAINTLDRLEKEEGWPTRQTEKGALHSLLARAYLVSAKTEGVNTVSLQRALGYAEVGVRQRPESALRRWILADAYSLLRDFDQAAMERETAFNLEAGLEILGTAEDICELANAYELSARFSKAELKTGRYQEARRVFQKLLQRIESSSLGSDPELWEERMYVHGCAHYWMGVFNDRLQERDKAIDHLEIARAMGYNAVSVTRRLKRIFAEAGIAAETPAQELHPVG